MAKPKKNDKKLVELVKDLADGYKWNWTKLHSDRDAADAVLVKMAALKMIRHKKHPLGGDVWIVGNQLFGRTDGISIKNYRGRRIVSHRQPA